MEKRSQQLHIHWKCRNHY